MSDGTLKFAIVLEEPHPPGTYCWSVVVSPSEVKNNTDEQLTELVGFRVREAIGRMMKGEEPEPHLARYEWKSI